MVFVIQNKKVKNIFALLSILTAAKLIQKHNSLAPVSRLYCFCVCCSDGVHWDPAQDEAQEALQLQEEEGHICHHRPHIPCIVSISISDFQLALLDCSPLYQVWEALNIQNVNMLPKLSLSNEFLHP